MLTEPTKYLSHLFNYVQTCVASPQSFMPCNSFWAVSYLFGFILSLIVFIKTLHFLYIERKEWKAFLERQEERAKVADEETMAKYVWNGDH